MIFKRKIKQFHIKIWIFTHGLATLMATHLCQFTEEEIDEMLTNIFAVFYQEEKRRGDKKVE